MDLNQKLQCVRPLIFGYDDPELPDFDQSFTYSLNGTCFLIGFQRTTFVVTARHVLKNHAPAGSDATSLNDHLRIFLAEGSRDFIPLDRCIQMEGDDKCYKDLLVFRVASRIMDHVQRRMMALTQFDISSLTFESNRLLRPRTSLVTRGYPFQSNYVDHQQLTIKQNATTIRGRVRGCDNIRRLCSISWDINDIRRIEEEFSFKFAPNGMSGSPVFHEKSGQLAGVLVMSNKSIGHFISASILYTVIRNYVLGTGKNAL